MQIQEAVARTLAILTASDAAAVELVASAGLNPILQLLKSSRTTSAALGNLALCIGNVAKQSSFLPVLRETDAVKVLLGRLCLLSLKLYA